jgi:predicted nucleic acid-binding protein
MLVLDASVALAWAFDDEVNPFAEHVIDQVGRSGALVPPIWPAEVANALLMGERRRRLSYAQSARFMGLLAQLPIAGDDERLADRMFGPVLALAREQRLTVYDASYLELAMRRGLPLATLDRRLRDAARSFGIPLVEH